jgi:hypothetical protein
MLQLNAEQVQRLQTIKRERDVRQLADTLAAGFADVPARLGERYAALIAHGVQRGAAQGLDHAVCVARYLACWFMLGAEFEAKPDFAWAREVLAAPGRPQGSKVFQLCRRTREELTRLAGQARPGTPAPMTSAAFEQAIVAMDAALMPRGLIGSLLPPTTVQLGEACDVDALDLRLIEPASGRQRHQYGLEQTQWRRLPVTAASPSVTLAAGTDARQPAPLLPPRLNVLSQPAERDYARLRVRTRASHCCDPAAHPLITLNGASGLASWRGPHAADVKLDFYAAPVPAAADDAPQPTIAVETPPQLNALSLSSCGLRDAGQALGDQHTQVAVYPAEQHLKIWQRAAAPAMSWPEPPAGQPSAPPARCRIERDGLPLDASRWQAGLEDLDRQLAQGLGRLATAWERESGVRQGRMQAEPAVFSGTAGLTWGWAEAPQGMAMPPTFRLAGMLDLVACQLNLRLGGELALHGSLSRLALHCSGRETLKLQFERRPADADLLAVVKPAACSFRHPFVLQLEAVAETAQAAVLDVAGPVGGAVTGSCGLRPRTAGPGLQWFCTLAIEPVSVPLRLHDPLLGQRLLVRPLLPALKLLDWSLG